MGGVQVLFSRVTITEAGHEQFGLTNRAAHESSSPECVQPDRFNERSHVTVQHIKRWGHPLTVYVPRLCYEWHLIAQPVITVILFAPQLKRHMVENINEPGAVLNVIATNNMAHSEEIPTGLLIT